MGGALLKPKAKKARKGGGRDRLGRDGPGAALAGPQFFTAQRTAVQRTKRRPSLGPGRDPRRSLTGREPGGRGRDQLAPGLKRYEPRCPQRPIRMQDGAADSRGRRHPLPAPDGRNGRFGYPGPQCGSARIPLAVFLGSDVPRRLVGPLRRSWIKNVAVHTGLTPRRSASARTVPLTIGQ